MKKTTMGGFLKYSTEGWKDSIYLMDGDRAVGWMWMPLVMDEAKEFDGKEVMITIELREP